MAEKTFKELVKEAISKLPKEPKEGDSTFDELAKLFLWGGVIKVGATEFRFIEIEFYLNDEKRNFDPYTHQHDGFQTGNFRPHESGLGADISIKEEKHYGGVLIRGIQKKGFNVVQGSFYALLAIFKEFKDIETGVELKISFKKSHKVKPIKVTRRIGLGKLHSGDENPDYKKIGWRYHTYDEGKDPKGCAVKRKIDVTTNV